MNGWSTRPAAAAVLALVAVAVPARGQLAYTEADVRFMTGMIPHHAQAVLMAGWAPSHGASGAVRRLCERIAVAQQDEIAFMRQWLADRGRPVPDAGPGHAHGPLMPGMLTPGQLGELDRARGADFDRLFLTYMIQHHEGALTMVDELFASQGAAQDEDVFKFAVDVHADQTTEIERMRTMLEAQSSGGRNP
ncbi:MAG TPA: DUF305 domain-containing protein [Gemmatimonadales bacterium]|nr:DUF305 domain-containing protein [Gemmatimonadales bacterium]